MLLSDIYKSPRIWSDTQITELLRFRNKTSLVGELNAKNRIWINKISKPSGLKLLQLFVCYDLEISSPQSSTRYNPVGTADIIDVSVHQEDQNVRLSDVIVTDVLDSDYFPVMFTFLDSARAREASDRIEKFTCCHRFQASLSTHVSKHPHFLF
jgi:hypothetical protein